MQSSFSRADVLVDADNVSSHRALAAESVARDAQECGYSLCHVHIVGRAIGVLAEYERACRICCPSADVSIARAWPGRNTADILAAIWLGRISYEVRSYTGQYQLYVLTRDKLVLTAARIAMGKGKTLVIPDDVVPKEEGSYRTFTIPGAIRTDATHSETDVSIPQWASEPPDPTNCVGLHWIESVETRQLQLPTFVPFPVRLAKVRLGSGNGNLDIDLSPWDMTGRRRSLYSPHVVFEYLSAPDSCWTIRSMRGHRRGRRKVALDGALISAASGPKTICEGSIIEIGNFTFKFQDNPTLNHVWLEDPKVMLERIERGCRYLVERLPLDVIPDKVRSELSSDGRFSWDHAYLRHYEQVFVGVLGKSLIAWVDETFQSKNEIRHGFGSLNRIRNTVFHPSRKPLAENDRERLASLFLRYVRGAGEWPT